MKIVLTFLLAVVLVMIPLLGIPQLGYSGLLSDDDITLSNELAEGQLVRFYLSANTEKGEEVLKENANKTAEILRNRLASLGYFESDVAVLSNRDVILTLPFNTDVSLAKEKLAATGNFMFKDADSKVILASGDGDIASCGVYSQVSSSGTLSYYLGFNLTEEALKRYTEKTTEISKSSDKYVQLYVDSTSLSRLNITEAVTENGFTIGPFEYEDAVWYSTMINAGPLPQAVSPAVHAIDPVLGEGVYTMIFVAALLALVVIAVACVILLKLSGVAAAFATVSALGAAMLLNTAFGLNVSLASVLCISFSVILTLVTVIPLLLSAKEQNSNNVYTCLKMTIRKKLWFLIDVLALPFAISLAMMIYGNVFMTTFANLVFVSVLAAVVGLLIAMLVISAFADANRKKSCVYGN